jgi:hypothetical protein
MLFDELARPIIASDMTGRIMARLGFARCSATGARRRLLRRRAVHAALGVATLVAVVLSVRLHSTTRAARVPRGPTIPSAIQYDLKRHEHAIDRAVKNIRSLLPSWPTAAPPGQRPTAPGGGEPLEEEPDQPAPSPFPWV